MIELKLQSPFIDENGKVYENLERHYAEDGYVEGYVNGNQVYNEPEFLTIKEINVNNKVFDLITKKAFKIENGVLIEDKINRYYIIQIETGIQYAEAVDVAPCRYTYKATEKMIEDIESDENK